jgi:hypothetical protein
MLRRSLATLLEHRMTLAALATVVGLVGCRVNPEAQSGGDGYRHEAQPLVLNSWITDDLGAATGDTTDWKAIEIAVPSQMVVEIRADESDAEFLVGAYDRYGVQLGKVERRESTSSWCARQEDLLRRIRYGSKRAQPSRARAACDPIFKESETTRA